MPTAMGGPDPHFALVVVEEVGVDASGGVWLQGREVVAAPALVGTRRAAVGQAPLMLNNRSFIRLP